MEYAAVTESVALTVARFEGVRYFRGGGRTHTVVMSTEPRMIRSVDTIHALKPDAGTQGFQP